MQKSVRMIVLLAILLGVLAILSYISGGTLFRVQASEEHREVRWLMAHSPQALYTDAIRVFSDELARNTDGTLQLRVVTPENVGLHVEGADVPYRHSMELLAQGEVELSSTYAVANGTDDPHFWTLTLPYLFSNYDSIPATLESASGEAILESYSTKTNARALAFTLSGGFRVIASKIPVASINDLKGLRVGTAGGPVAEATLRAFGAIPVSMGLDDAPSPASVDAVETTYARISLAPNLDSDFLSYVLETNHSLFLTTIVTSDAFFDSLSGSEQRALTSAARSAARTERAASVVLAQDTKKALKEAGSVITTLSEGDVDVAKAATASVYADFADTFDQELVRTIQGEQQ